MEEQKQQKDAGPIEMKIINELVLIKTWHVVETYSLSVKKVRVERLRYTSLVLQSEFLADIDMCLIASINY